MSEHLSRRIPGGYTAVPNWFIDQHLSILSGAQVKVALYVYRRTLGFNKDTDAIALSQFQDGLRGDNGKWHDEGTGLVKRTIIDAVAFLDWCGLIHRTKSKGRGNVYSIVLEPPDAYGDWVQEPHSASAKTCTTPSAETCTTASAEIAPTKEEEEIQEEIKIEREILAPVLTNPEPPITAGSRDATDDPLPSVSRAARTCEACKSSVAWKSEGGVEHCGRCDPPKQPVLASQVHAAICQEAESREYERSQRSAAEESEPGKLTHISDLVAEHLRALQTEQASH